MPVRRIKPYRQTITCFVCKEEKDWKRFAQGFDTKYPRCLDCHREDLRQKAKGEERPVNQKSIDKVFKYLDKKAK